VSTAQRIELEGHPFEGLVEKLKRANEHILQLKSEIDTFFRDGKYQIIPKDDDKLFREAMEYHSNRRIPLRFGVIAGEVAHQFRSCLDHVVWHFSDDISRGNPKVANGLEFPILEVEPRNSNERARYNRKIEGISKAGVITLICNQQPYRLGADAPNHPLLIIHNMDRFDKHRELATFVSCGNMRIPVESLLKVARHQKEKLSEAEINALGAELKQNCEITPQVTFREFGKGDRQAVVPGLQELGTYVRDLITLFAEQL
jgi:hypothetical protein